jgi:hypothetical protein
MGRMLIGGLLLVQAVMAQTWARAAEPLVWVEGEQASRKTVIANPGLEAVDTHELSGSAWLASFANEGQPTGSADYSVDISAPGKYQLWVRGTGSGLTCRIDDQAPVAVDMAKETQHLTIAADGSPAYPTIGWYRAGEIELASGKHSITWTLGGETAKARFGAIDCFVLAAGAFTPNDQYKPGEQPKLLPAFQPGTTWDFAPAVDKFDPAALLDLRGLNEKRAGDHGFVRLSEDGNSFVCSDGTPLRFWASGERTQNDPDMAALKVQARFLAKRGVNALRIFAMLPSKDPNAQVGDIDEKELDCVFRVVAAMKEAGIYTILDGYWAGATTMQKNWDVARSGKPSAESLVYFDPKMQAGYRSMLKALCTRVNPYTGIKLAEEPAVAVIQLQNEDSLLWWGINDLKGEAQVLLRQKYAQFLRGKYGTLEKALQTWQGFAASNPADEMDKGLPGFLNVWDFTAEAWKIKSGSAGWVARSADQMEFFCRTMSQFNEETEAYLRKDLGCRQLINANNWRTVDLTTTQDAQYWADSANEVMARNIYTGGLHSGVNNGWQIANGHLYSDLSHTKEPQKMPMNVRQPMGHPYILPEVLWVPPNLYQSEAPLMMAGQQSLTGLAAGCWFSNWVEPWDQNPMTKWTYSTPMQIGQFPAAALIYRLGYLKAAEPAVVEHRLLSDLWHRKVPMTSEEPGWDPNRDLGNRPLGASRRSIVDPLAYLVGPVRVVFDSNPSQSTLMDLSKYINREAKRVTSATGEIETDYGAGVYRINAPKVQAAAGFLKSAGTQVLADVQIACDNEYAAITVLSLDNKPIRESGRLLVQIGTLARPTGWTTRPARVQEGGVWNDCLRIVSVGQAPWQVQKAVATLTLNNNQLKVATVLDANGMATAQKLELQSAGPNTTITLPPDALYVMLSTGN